MTHRFSLRRKDWIRNRRSIELESSKKFIDKLEESSKTSDCYSLFIRNNNHKLRLLRIFILIVAIYSIAIRIELKKCNTIVSTTSKKSKLFYKQL